MELVSMKNTPAEAKAEVSPAADGGPEYPYGLRLDLNDDALKKLGITSLPEVGTPLVLQARAQVCSTSAYDSQEGGASRCIGVQITDLAIAPAPQPERQVTPDEFYAGMGK